MNSLIEEENILTFGNKSIDVSNVSYYRSERSIDTWNKVISKEGFTELEVNEMCEKVGLYMIRQDFSVLRLRMTFIESVKNYVKRYLLTIKHIKKSNKEEYNIFQDWVYFSLTGNKKKDLETDVSMMETTRKIYREMEAQGINQDQCATLLLTLLKDQMNDLKNLNTDHKVS